MTVVGPLPASIKCTTCGTVSPIVEGGGSSTGLSAPGVPRQKRSVGRRVARALASIILFLIVLAIVVYGVVPAFMAYYDGLNRTTGFQGSSMAYYDLQIAEEFYNSFASLEYNVTATAQSDAYGFGPGYLLNGLTDQGYWYQVGFSWNWTYADFINHAVGFKMSYEVFNPSFNSIYPANGGGIKNFSGTVNPGDIINLGLKFSGGNVVMSAVDLQTNASSIEKYASFNATTFVGTQSTNNGHTFSGLMTEWYHADPSQINMKQVNYSISGSPVKGASFFVEELNFTNNTPFKTPPVFQQSQSTVFFTQPSQIKTFTLDGVTIRASGYNFVTGS